MKRLFAVMLAALLLAGCGAKPPAPEPTEPVTQPTETDPTLYQSGSNMEEQTEGAVRQYALTQNDWFALRSVGANLLLAGSRGLMLLSGENAEQTAVLETDLLTSSEQLDTAPTGVAYYSPDSRKVFVRNPQLQSIAETELPEAMQANPLVNLNANEVYYTTGAEIRAMNLTTGISRLVRQQSTPVESLDGLYFDGSVLFCTVKNADGTLSHEYLSTQTGQTLGKDGDIFDMHTLGEAFFLQRLDGAITQVAFGARGSETKSLLAPVPEVRGGFAPALAMNGAVSYGDTEAGLALSFYDFESGKCMASVVLAGVASPTALHCDGSYIWVLSAEKDAQTQTLWRWDVKKSPSGDESVYTGPLYTPENPDETGLAQCRELANSYEKAYGVKLLLWQAAVENTGTHAVTAEHHPQVLKAMLADLQPVLALFPEAFLQKTVEAGWIRIALVRSIADGSNWVQFWDKGDCWIILSAQADVKDGFLQGLAYGIDSHVIGNSRDYDTWNQLNPEGVNYTYAYLDSVPAGQQALFEDATRVFADLLCAAYPHEDRCRVFYNAMLADNAAMFQSPVMQAKLLRVCTGIREAYGLDKSTETFAWEQYLAQPIAYVKE